MQETINELGGASRNHDAVVESGTERPGCESPPNSAPALAGITKIKEEPALSEANSLFSCSHDGQEQHSRCGSCATSAVDLSVPSFHAKSPTLIKAKIAVAGSASRGCTLARNFTLRGKRQSRQTYVNTGGGKAIPSDVLFTAFIPRPPRPRPPLRLLMMEGDVGAGYSPRLRMMGPDAGDSTNLTEDMKTYFRNCAAPSSALLEPRKLRGSQSIAAATNYAFDTTCEDDLCAEDSKEFMSGAKTKYLVFCHEDPRQGKTEEFIAHQPEHGNGGLLATTTRHPSTPHRGHPARQMRHGLCGRLCTGTTAPPKKALREFGAEHPANSPGRTSVHCERTLFLVSGQGQGLESRKRLQAFNANAVGVDSSAPRGGFQSSKDGRRCYFNNHHPTNGSRMLLSDSAPAPRRGTRSITTVRVRTTKITAMTAPYCDEECGNAGVGTLTSPRFHGWDCNQGDENEVSLPTTPSTHSHGDGDNVTNVASTAREQEGSVGPSGRPVLHVRVPRPPPTSLLVLRSAPVSQSSHV